MDTRLQEIRRSNKITLGQMAFESDLMVRDVYLAEIGAIVSRRTAEKIRDGLLTLVGEAPSTKELGIRVREDIEGYNRIQATRGIYLSELVKAMEGLYNDHDSTTLESAEPYTCDDVDQGARGGSGRGRTSELGRDGFWYREGDSSHHQSTLQVSR